MPRLFIGVIKLLKAPDGLSVIKKVFAAFELIIFYENGEEVSEMLWLGELPKSCLMLHVISFFLVFDDNIYTEETIMAYEKRKKSLVLQYYYYSLGLRVDTSMYK